MNLVSLEFSKGIYQKTKSCAIGVEYWIKLLMITIANNETRYFIVDCCFQYEYIHT